MVINFYINASCWHEIIYNPPICQIKKWRFRELESLSLTKSVAESRLEPRSSEQSLVCCITVFSWLPFLRLTKIFKTREHILPSYLYSENVIRFSVSMIVYGNKLECERIGRFSNIHTGKVIITQSKHSLDLVSQC